MVHVDIDVTGAFIAGLQDDSWAHSKLFSMYTEIALDRGSGFEDGTAQLGVVTFQAVKWCIAASCLPRDLVLLTRRRVKCLQPMM